jgi:hypothetical protein
VIYSIGEKLLSVFGQAHGITWDEPTQLANMRAIVKAQKDLLFETPKPRFFVYQYCRFLDQQKDQQRSINAEQASAFVSNNEPPLDGDGT